jgi:predicted nucleic acid-binding protein
MNSLDTNILVYAANEDCEEYAKANVLVNEALASPGDWIIADQVLFEYYRALRHPGILSKPLAAPAAAAQVSFLRQRSGFMFCCYELTMWDKVFEVLETGAFPYRRTHDLVLGETLRNNGVITFYTRNIKDFAEIGFPNLVNPIDA